MIDGCTAALPPQDSVGRLNFRAIVDGLGGVLFQHVTQLATNKFGVHMAAKLASRLVRRTWPLPRP